MKTVTAPMQAHLQEGSTTLTTCWKITRTDGQEFHYTELDEDITYENDVYKSAAGFNKSAIQSSATFSVDKLEVTGFLRDDGITDEEIRNGAFDYASVEVFMVNYMNLSMGKIRLRAGWFGEVRTTGSGAFLVELRGLVDMLQVKIGNTYLPECRVDLGSTKCGIKLVPEERQGGKTYKVGDRVVWPVELDEFIGARNFPELVDINSTPNHWSTDGIKSNLDVTAAKGPKFIRASTTSGVNSGAACPVRFADLGFTQADVDSQKYKVTFRFKYYKFTAMARGHARIGCQEQYFGTGIYTPLTDEYFTLEPVPPKRIWVQGEVSIDVHPATDRFIVSVQADTFSNGISTICFDDFDFVISLRDEQVSSFAQYGGVEFECMTEGKTAQVAPVFTTDGLDVPDGTLIWRSTTPKYTFLRELTADMTATNSLKIDPVPEAWENFFDWGVLRFLTGENAGRAMEIQNYNPTTGVIKLALPLPYRGLTGDLISIQAGCNKTTTSCKLFNNILNFRGHPRVPGQGQYFKIAGM